MRRRFMEKKMMKSNGAGSRSSAMKRRRLFSAAAVLLAVCLVFVGAAGADGVAQIEGKEPFTSIQDAINSVDQNSKATITVTNDHKLDCTKVNSESKFLILVDNGKDITIDLNGYTVTADFTSSTMNVPKSSVIMVADGAKLTMTDNSASKTGTLHAITTEATQNALQFLLRNAAGDNKGWLDGFNSENWDSNLESCLENCNLVIKGGTYKIDYGRMNSKDYVGSIVRSDNSYTTWVDGGTFWMGNVGARAGETGWNNAPWLLDGSSGDANRIIVTGGTFFKTDVNHMSNEFEVYVPKDHALRETINEMGESWWTVVPAVAYVTEYQMRSDWFVAHPDVIGGKDYNRDVGYATVEEAVSNVGKHHASSRTDDFEQYTITLIEDADVTETLKFGTSESPLAKSTVFDMSNHKLIWKGGADDKLLTVFGDGNTLTINSFNIIREGYTITMWNLDSQQDATLPVTANGQVVVQTSLSVADSTVNKYTITFDTKGGSAVEPITLDYGTEIAAPAEPTKTGYTFSGWDSSIPETMPAKDMTVTAHWTPITYSVAFYANGGDGGMDDQEFTYDVPQSLTLNAFTKTGYTFTGWKTNPNDSKSVYTDGQLVKNLTTINEGTVTLYANWTANKHTVTFDAGEGAVSEPTKEVTFDQPYGTLPIPTREGHNFVGWYLGDTLITENIEVTVDEDHTLTAHWEKTETPSDIPEEEEIITSPSSGGGGDGGHLSFPRTTENGGLVDFGSSKVVKSLMLPEGSSGSVLLKVDTVEKWPKALDTEYTFDISVEKLGDGMAYIHFEIPVSTLESLELTPADICAYHFEGEVWTKLPTTYEVKDGTVCYEAETDSFSPFKLVIEEGAATQKEEENVPTVPPTEEPDVPDEPEILPPIDEPAKPTEPETPAPILAVLAGLGAAFIVRRK